ncbi:chitinase [Legionella quateirensis]|uniref:Chitinase domain protein n=1 Tax=Legionella quateirensis TaxID=45072 RepID=A0A378KUC9_9GAMM|nr:chitinase [Legionella quateirensis]KTD42438.1 chitinase domain protein [Legionella quateirensis]STY17107.1 chitinase domain protein [Legionella quateirensis]
MRYSRIISFINGLMMSGNVIALTLPAIPTFSPYVDLTLNTHWDSQSQDIVPMDLTTPAQTEGIGAYHLAFITDSGRCQPAWGGQQAYSLEKQWGKQEADALANAGVRLTVSFGGANGTDISQNCDKNQLNTIFQQVIKIYHATGLDFDIENGSADVSKLIDALQNIQQQYPELKLSFTLPVMPEGLTGDGKNVIHQAKNAGLRFHVNIMAMDYGPAYNGDMGLYAIQAATNVQSFLKDIYPERMSASLWNLIEVTPMIGVNDVNTEQFTLSDADHLKRFAYENQLGGLSMWSFTRDKPCSDQWASPVCSGNNLQSRDYEYIAHFK